jgi:hypothetical protein
MVVGPTSGASVAIACIASLCAGGFWSSSKQVPAELPTMSNTSSVLVPSLKDRFTAVEESITAVEEILQEHTETPNASVPRADEIFENHATTPDGSLLVVEEILEEPRTGPDAETEAVDDSSIFENKADIIQARSFELIDQVIHNCTEGFAGADVREREKIGFVTTDIYDVTRVSIQNIKEAFVKALDSNNIQANFINVISSEGSFLAWTIMMSWPIDLLLLFCMCGCCRKSKAETCEVPAFTSGGSDNLDEARDSDDATELNSPGSPRDVSSEPLSPEQHVPENSSASTEQILSTDSKVNDTDANIMPAQEETAQDITSPNLEAEVPSNVVQRSSRKSNTELQALMERKRKECEVVENTQASVSTDAKANEQPTFLASQARETDGQNHGQMRAKCRNSSDFKALMEKKRDQCQVVENTQEHVKTDAKAFCRNAEGLAD